MFFLRDKGSIQNDPANQKRNAWATIALTSGDQLRQRMAWALSQILVVTPNQIGDIGYSEVYLNYYDIFVRNAFGNYFDIIKEVVSFPPSTQFLSSSAFRYLNISLILIFQSSLPSPTLP